MRADSVADVGLSCVALGAFVCMPPPPAARSPARHPPVPSCLPATHVCTCASTGLHPPPSPTYRKMLRAFFAVCMRRRVHAYYRYAPQPGSANKYLRRWIFTFGGRNIETAKQLGWVVPCADGSQIPPSRCALPRMHWRVRSLASAQALCSLSLGPRAASVRMDATLQILLRMPGRAGPVPGRASASAGPGRASAVLPSDLRLLQGRCGR
jgi:hypothetical protein